MQQKTYRLNQRLAPLHEARAEYRNSRVVLFDVPGHKQRRGTPKLTKFLGNECLSVDVNSMKPIDNLSPQPPSSRRPKSSLPTRHSLSSAARRRPVQAMVMSVCKAGDSMIYSLNFT